MLYTNLKIVVHKYKRSGLFDLSIISFSNQFNILDVCITILGRHYMIRLLRDNPLKTEPPKEERFNLEQMRIDVKKYPWLQSWIKLEEKRRVNAQP